MRSPRGTGSSHQRVETVAVVTSVAVMVVVMVVVVMVVVMVVVEMVVEMVVASELSQCAGASAAAGDCLHHFHWRKRRPAGPLRGPNASAFEWLAGSEHVLPVTKSGDVAERQAQKGASRKLLGISMHASGQG